MKRVWTQEDRDRLLAANPAAQRILKLSVEEITQQKDALEREFSKMSPHMLMTFWYIVASRETTRPTSPWLITLHPCYSPHLLVAAKWMDVNGYNGQPTGKDSARAILIDDTITV